MKSRLRKQFEEFKETTEWQLWLLNNPPKFKFNDRIRFYNSGNFYDVTFKGIKEIKKDRYGMERICLIEIGNNITEVGERTLSQKP